MEKLSFHTERCIATGQPAKVWSGHLYFKSTGPIDVSSQLPHHLVSVIAGFASEEIHEQTPSGSYGCYGEWRPEHGLIVALNLSQSKQIEHVMAADLCVVRSELVSVATDMYQRLVHRIGFTPESVARLKLALTQP